MSTEQSINTIENQQNTVETNPVETNTIQTSDVNDVKPSDVNDEKQIIPKMYYKIIPKNAKVVYNEIKERTNNFTINNTEYKQWLINQLKDRNSEYMYGFLNDSPSLDVNKQVVGKDGCYLMMTTQNYNCLFIWHNRTTHQFEFWSDNRTSLVHAMNTIRTRLHK